MSTPGADRGAQSSADAVEARIPQVPTEELLVQWAPPSPARSRPPRSRLAGGALATAIIGLVVSLFVGWGFPIGLVAIVLAILAIRRPQDSRAIAIWALALALLSLVYSAIWLTWAVIAGAAGG